MNDMRKLMESVQLTEGSEAIEQFKACAETIKAELDPATAQEFDLIMRQVYLLLDESDDYMGHYEPYATGLRN